MITQSVINRTLPESDILLPNHVGFILFLEIPLQTSFHKKLNLRDKLEVSGEETLVIRELYTRYIRNHKALITTIGQLGVAKIYDKTLLDNSKI